MRAKDHFIWIRTHCWSVKVRFTIIRLCLFIEIVHFTKIALWITSEIVRILIAIVLYVGQKVHFVILFMIVEVQTMQGLSMPFAHRVVWQTQLSIWCAPSFSFISRFHPRLFSNFTMLDLAPTLPALPSDLCIFSCSMPTANLHFHYLLMALSIMACVNRISACYLKINQIPN